MDGHPWIVDINYFLCDVVRSLTLEEAERSIYRFIEQTTGYRIIASRRIFSIRKATRFDRDHLELDGCNCVGIIMNNAFMIITTSRTSSSSTSKYTNQYAHNNQYNRWQDSSWTVIDPLHR